MYIKRFSIIGILYLFTGLENQAPSDDDNSSQQSEPRNITSESKVA